MSPAMTIAAAFSDLATVGSYELLMLLIRYQH
jgi:hypothetical protein